MEKHGLIAADCTLLYGADFCTRLTIPRLTMFAARRNHIAVSAGGLFEIHHTISLISKLIFVIKELTLDLIYIKRDN